MRAVRVHEVGGPDAMRLDDTEIPAPAQVLVRNGAAGVTFIDLHQRAGRYPVPDIPLTLGMEGAGAVESVGDEVHDVKPGDRVSCVMGGHGAKPGSYAQFTCVPAEALIQLPDEIDDVTAAGLTAQYLIRGAYPVRNGQTILVHAAAGGVGLVLCQWAKVIGARVIGTVGSEAKAEVAFAHGCVIMSFSTVERMWPPGCGR